VVNIFLDNPLVKDFILVNTSNQTFNLTSGSKNIPPGAVGTLRAFDVDFCELKYKYTYMPAIKEIFDSNWLATTPVLGTSVIHCAWEPSSTSSSGGGATEADSNMLKVDSADEAATYLDDALVVETPLTKEVVSNPTPLPGGGVDKFIRLGLNPNALTGVGSFLTYDFAEITTDGLPVECGYEILETGSFSWTFFIHAVGTTGFNANKRTFLKRDLHVSFNSGVQTHLLQSPFTHNRPTGWNFSVQPVSDGIKFFVTGDALSSVTWKISVLKTQFML
jgi:hypothetical protein